MSANNINGETQVDLWEINSDYEYQEKALITKTGLKKLNSCKFWILSTISLFLSINLGLIVWDLIELPYQNPKGLTGPLTLINFNPLNNIFRFISFVGIPTVVFIVICRLFLVVKDNEKINPILNETKSYVPNVILIFILFNLLNSFINDFEDYSTLDTFHEGESLTAAFNTIFGLGIWKGLISYMELFMIN